MSKEEKKITAIRTHDEIIIDVLKIVSDVVVQLYGMSSQKWCAEKANKIEELIMELSSIERLEKPKNHEHPKTY